MLILTEENDAATLSGILPHRNEVSRFVRLPVPRETKAEVEMVSRFTALPAEGLFLTDVRSMADIEKASSLLRVAAAKSNRPQRTPQIIANIDTPEAALGISGFNRAVAGLCALVLDEPALADTLGMDPKDLPLQALRPQFILAAKVCGAVPLLRMEEHRAADADNAPLRGQGFAGLVLASRS